MWKCIKNMWGMYYKTWGICGECIKNMGVCWECVVNYI